MQNFTENAIKQAFVKLLEEKRIGYYAVADYTEGSDMDKLLKDILDKTAENRTDDR